MLPKGQSFLRINGICQFERSECILGRPSAIFQVEWLTLLCTHVCESKQLWHSTCPRIFSVQIITHAWLPLAMIPYRRAPQGHQIAMYKCWAELGILQTNTFCNSVEVPTWAIKICAAVSPSISPRLRNFCKALACKCKTCITLSTVYLMEDKMLARNLSRTVFCIARWCCQQCTSVLQISIGNSFDIHGGNYMFVDVTCLSLCLP